MADQYRYSPPHEATRWPFVWEKESDVEQDEPIGWTLAGNGKELFTFDNPSEKEFQALNRLLASMNPVDEGSTHE